MSIRGTLSPRSFRDSRARIRYRIGFPLTPHASPRQGARRPHRPLTHGLLLVIISAAVGYATITQGGFPGKTRAFAAPSSTLSMPGVSASAVAVDEAVVRAPLITRTLRVERDHLK